MPEHVDNSVSESESEPQSDPLSQPKSGKNGSLLLNWSEESELGDGVALGKVIVMAGPTSRRSSIVILVTSLFELSSSELLQLSQLHHPFCLLFFSSSFVKRLENTLSTGVTSSNEESS